MEGGNAGVRASGSDDVKHCGFSWLDPVGQLNVGLDRFPKNDRFTENCWLWFFGLARPLEPTDRFFVDGVGIVGLDVDLVSVGVSASVVRT